jgi:hypothetical protein
MSETHAEEVSTSRAVLDFDQLYNSYFRIPSLKKRAHVLNDIIRPKVQQQHDQLFIQKLLTNLILPSSDYMWERFSQDYALNLVKLFSVEDATTAAEQIVNYEPRSTTSASVCIKLLSCIFEKLKALQHDALRQLLHWSYYVFEQRYNNDFATLATLLGELKLVVRALFKSESLLQLFLEQVSAGDHTIRLIGLQILLHFATKKDIDILTKDEHRVCLHISLLIFCDSVSC